VLLPSDKHRKPITSITAVLLPFVTYLLTITSNMEQITKGNPAQNGILTAKQYSDKEFTAQSVL
jgi:hypothetical protein